MKYSQFQEETHDTEKKPLEIETKPVEPQKTNLCLQVSQWLYKA